MTSERVVGFSSAAEHTVCVGEVSLLFVGETGFAAKSWGELRNNEELFIGSTILDSLEGKEGIGSKGTI